MSQMMPEELMAMLGGGGQGPPPGMGGPPMGGPPPGMGAPQGPPRARPIEEVASEIMDLFRELADSDKTDAIETADVMKFMADLQKMIANRQKETDAAFGAGPATKVLRRG